jgi:hypothetical protein
MSKEAEFESFTGESKKAIEVAEGLGYLTKQQISGDLFEVLNIVAEKAFRQDENNNKELIDKLNLIRELSTKVRLPFFGITVHTNDEGEITLQYVD